MVCGLALSAFLGWLSGWLLLARFDSNYIPMAPTSALACLLLGAGLWIESGWPNNRRARVGIAGLAVLAMILAALWLILNLAGSALEAECVSFLFAKRRGGMPVQIMSPVTAAALFLAATAFLASATAAWRHLTAALAAGVAAIGAVVLLSYAYGMPLLYDQPIIPIALPTSLPLLFLGLGLLSLSDRRDWPIRLVVGPSVRARLLRAILPVTLAMFIGENWLQLAVLPKYAANPAIWTLLVALASFVVVGGVIAVVSQGVGRAVDIAEAHRRRAEEERERAALETQDLYDNAPCGYHSVDADGRVCRMNNTELSWLGYARDEIVGRMILSDLIAPESRETYRRTMALLGKQGWLTDVEFDMVRKDGSIMPVLLNAAAVTDSAGNLMMSHTTLFDVTERKQAGDNLKRAQEDLEGINHELQEASQIKSQFLAAVSHEIRTPLNAIIGLTGLLLDTDQNAEQRDCTQTIRTSSEVLLSLIKNILDFSKIQSERMELENRPFDLSQCVKESLALVNDSADEKRIEMAWRIDTSLPRRFFGDAAKLMQILVNLLGNAVKFTEKGRVVLSVSGQPCNHDLHELHFAVNDTGLGIPPNAQVRLFQPFSQIDASSNRRFGGSGLGLAIGRRLAELMGGRMWVESDGIPGQGSTFHFIIQAAVAGDPAALEPSPSATTPQDADAQPHALRILLVEDNPINQKVTRTMLARMGHQADIVVNGREALDAIRDVSYDVILMDCQMPVMDGYEATRQIRQCEAAQRRPPVRIIAMTAHVMPGDREQCLAAGMDDYLGKPVRFADLAHVLQQCVPGTHVMDCKS